MRVALDATPLTLSSGGLARYTAELSLALAHEFSDDEFSLISDQPFRMPPEAPCNLRAGLPPSNARERRWWLWGANRESTRAKAHVFHGTNFEVPYLPRLPVVMTLHDLSPWLNPDWHRDASRVRGRTPYLIGLGTATMIITPSTAIRREAIERFQVSPGRIVAVPLAAAAYFQPVPSPQNAKYFLYVGTLEPRKNLATLLAAWREVRRGCEVDLVVAGRRRADFTEMPAEPGLRILGEVSDADLPALYSGALALVYPSHYEGFGLPVLEAMQCGACVIVSRDPAIHEVAGEAAIYAESVREIAQAMQGILDNPERAAILRAQSIARARTFSWGRTARQTREVYVAAIERYG